MSTTDTYVPVAGNWNQSTNDGKAKVGLYDRTTGVFYLDLVGGTHSTPAILTAFSFGAAGHNDLPVIGDWNGDGRDDLGIFDPTETDQFSRSIQTETTCLISTSTRHLPLV